MALLANRESQLLVDGKLIGGGGGTFTTINPATEEVLGTAADPANLVTRRVRPGLPAIVESSGNRP